MKNKFIKIICFLLIMFSMCSCSITDIESFLSEFNSIIDISTSDSSSTNNESIDDIISDDNVSILALNEAFNGSINNKDEQMRNVYDLTYNSFENTTRLNFTNNIQDLPYNDGITPCQGNVKGLVIPVQFPDALAKKQINLKSLNCDYQSVSSYYYNSSYGKLNMSFDVLDWQMLSHNSSYYQKLKTSYSGEVPGVSAIINEVLTNLNNSIDYSKYDSDGDGYIDCLYIIYSHEIDYNDGNFWWAYQYYYFEEDYFDKVSPYSYIFAGYDFLFENEDNTLTTNTFIHETGHLLGLQDYYDYDNSTGFNKGALGGADMMDYNTGDHNPYSKLSLGWINNPILPKLSLSNKSTTITLKPYCQNGDTLMICDDYDASKNIYQSYFLIIYNKTNDSLDSNSMYSKDGIRVYRVHGELQTFSDEYGDYEYLKYDNSYTSYNLIDSIIADQLRKQTASNYGLYSKFVYSNNCAKNSDLFYEGYTINSLTLFNSKTSRYNIKVDQISNDKATLTISYS